MPQVRAALSTTILLGSLACQSELPADVPWVTAETHESHEVYFPIDSGKHEGIDCNKCHGDYDTFTEFTCTSCHVHAAEETDPAHAAVPDYTYSETSCFGCHPRGTVDGAGPGHELIFPIAAPSVHAEVSCAGCHVDSGDRSVVTCIDCHAHEAAASQIAHALVGGYGYETTGCLRCHYDSGVPRVADHVPFRIDPEAAHAPSEAACLECHDELQADRPFESADFGRFDCTPCHTEPDMNAEHGSMVGYRYASETCVVCHGDGEGTSRAAHDRTFPISEATAHAETQCADCHTDAADVEVVTCAGCHPHAEADTAAAHTAVGGYRFDSADCMKCHYESQVDPVAQHTPFRIDADAAHAPSEAECLECHDELQAGRPFESADFGRFDCTPCHAQAETDAEHAGLADYRYASEDCSRCHPDGQAMSREAHDSIFLVSAGNAHESTDCAGCHSDPNDAEDVTCVGCHPHEAAATDGAHTSVGGYRFASSDCLDCHADRPVYRLSQHQPFRIDGGSKHRPSRADCMECHPSKDPSRAFVTAAFDVFDCLDCHERGETDGHHREEPRYQYDSPTCVMSGCHPTGEEDD